MRVIASFGLGILLGCAPLLGYSDELPPFEGQTVADAALKQEALKLIPFIIKGTLGCTAIDVVSTRPLSLNDAQARTPVHLRPKGTEADTYEEWTISACSKSQAVIAIFWVDGGVRRVAIMTEKVSDS